jgi:RNA-directed DNA polymerase
MDGRQQKEVEPLTAVPEDETPAGTENLIEEVCERNNLRRALKRVRANKGAPGVDGMTVDELPKYLKKHWPSIGKQVMSGKYKPKPVKRVEIPKSGGGVRQLGIPCVLDRFIQQAVHQVLQARWDSTFSDNSFGFRPGRSAHQAVAQAQQYIAEGHTVAVDLDLEKYFDRVNHDRLMAQVAKGVLDKRLLRLIRAFLKAGIMDGGLVQPSKDEGMPQGGPLSPLLSNLYLDELDRELTRRGHRFVRYADDCNVYVRTERAGERVMKSIKRYLGKKLKLRLNEKKSKVRRVTQSKFLGFRFSLRKGKVRPLISEPSLERLRRRVRQLTNRRSGKSIRQLVEALSSYLRGWRSYYGFSGQTKLLCDLDSWIRRRLRSYLWQMWKTRRRRAKALTKLGLKNSEAKALAYVGRNHGPWAISHTQAMHIALPNKLFRSLGLFELGRM